MKILATFAELGETNVEICVFLIILHSSSQVSIEGTHILSIPVLIPKEGIVFFLDSIPSLTKSLSVNLEKVRVIIFRPSFFFKPKALGKIHNCVPLLMPKADK